MISTPNLSKEFTDQMWQHSPQAWVKTCILVSRRVCSPAISGHRCLWSEVSRPRPSLATCRRKLVSK